MNNIEPGNERPTRAPRQGGEVNRPPVRRRKKKKPNILPAIVLGIVGVVIIALIIMGVKSLLSGGSPKNVKEDSSSSSVLNTTAGPSASPAATATPAPATPAPEVNITGLEVIQFDDMVIVGNGAYDYYKFDKAKADRYTAAINAGAAALGSGVTVYNMIIPGAVDVMLPLSFLDENSDKTSDQAKAIKYIASGFGDGIVPVQLYDTLKAHCNEALYFKSDNRWTSLAAYYAYSQWANEKGLTPNGLSGYEKISVGGFLGNLYTYTESPAISSEETFDVYKPKAALSLTFADGEDPQALFPDVSEEDSDGKLKVFLGGSHAYTKIANADKADASACILVSDSNGTIIAPYFAENYQYTYVLDYRSFEGVVSELASEVGAKDVIYCTSILATSAESLIEGLTAVGA